MILKFSLISIILLVIGFFYPLKVLAADESKELMSGKVLRVAVLHYPPAIILKEQNGTDDKEMPVKVIGGTALMYLNYLADALNISFEFVLLKDSDLKKYGLATVQINAIVNDEADFLVLGFVASEAKNKLVDLSVPFMIEPHRIIVPWPKEESRLLAIIRPFQSYVWLCLGLTLIFLTYIIPRLSELNRIYVTPSQEIISDSHRHSPVQTGRGSAIHFFHLMARNGMYILALLTYQGYQVRLSSRSAYIIAGVWCLMTIVLANGYAGTLFSFLSVAKLEPVINSLEELANSKVNLMIQDRTDLCLRLLNATNGPEKLIGNSLRANPDNMISNFRHVKEKLKTGTCAFTHFNLYNYGLINAVNKENGNKCLVTLAKEPISLFSPVVHAMAKNGPYTKAINRKVQAQIEAGLYVYARQSLMPRIDNCKIENYKKSARQKSLSLVDMSSAFVVFGIGASLSILVFLVELIFKRIHYHRKLFKIDQHEKPTTKMREKKFSFDLKYFW